MVDHPAGIAVISNEGVWLLPNGFFLEQWPILDSFPGRVVSRVDVFPNTYDKKAPALPPDSEATQDAPHERHSSVRPTKYHVREPRLLDFPSLGRIAKVAVEGHVNLLLKKRAGAGSR